MHHLCVAFCVYDTESDLLPSPYVCKKGVRILMSLRALTANISVVKGYISWLESHDTIANQSDMNDLEINVK